MKDQPQQKSFEMKQVNLNLDIVKECIKTIHSFTVEIIKVSESSKMKMSEKDVIFNRAIIIREKAYKMVSLEYNIFEGLRIPESEQK